MYQFSAAQKRFRHCFNDMFLLAAGGPRARRHTRRSAVGEYNRTGGRILVVTRRWHHLYLTLYYVAAKTLELMNNWTYEWINEWMYAWMYASVGADGQTRQLRDEDCCPRREEHRIIYPTQTGMIPNYTGHLPGNYTSLLHSYTSNFTTDCCYMLHILIDCFRICC